MKVANSSDRRVVKRSEVFERRRWLLKLVLAGILSTAFVRLVRSVDLMFVSKETIGILVDARCVVLPPGMVAVQFQELTRHSPFSY